MPSLHIELIFHMFLPDSAPKVQLKHLLFGISCSHFIEHFTGSLKKFKSKTYATFTMFVLFFYLSLFFLLFLFVCLFLFYVGVWTACSTAGPIQH